MVDFNDLINKINVIFMNILGTIGNVSLVFMTIRCKDLHFKCGYILSILSVCNLLLLWNDLQFLYLQFANINDGNPMWCFYYNVIYFVLQTADVSLWAVTGVDRFLSIWRPFWYNGISTSTYLSLICLPVLVICLLLLTWSSISIRLAALPPGCWLDPSPVVIFFDLYTNGCRVITCILYGVVYFQIRQIRSKNEDSQLVRKQIALVSTLICVVALNAKLLVLTLVVRGLRKVSSAEGVVTVCETLFNILVELIWSIDFYIYILRSKQYRRAFAEVFLRRKRSVIRSKTSVPPLFKIVAPHLGHNSRE